MTVFEKIKEMNKDEMVEFLNIIGNVEFFSENFCENLCKGFTGCKEDNAKCITDYDDLIEIKALLSEDYGKFLEDSMNDKKRF